MNKLIDLLVILNRADRTKSPQLFQAVSELIKRLQQNQNDFPTDVASVISSGGAGGGAIGAPANATYLTAAVESSLPNSRQLIAGTNITLDISTPGQMVINSTGTQLWIPVNVGEFFMTLGDGRPMVIPFDPPSS